MRQAVLEKPEKIVFREIAEPRPHKGEVLLQVQKIGICGSDIHAYYGRHPFITCPIVQGHEVAAMVSEIGEGVENIKVGDRVTIMPQLFCKSCYACKSGRYNICKDLQVIGCQAAGAAQELMTVDTGLLVKLPESLTLDQGVMVEPASVGVHAAAMAGELNGKNILVLGAGTIGNLTAQALKGLGARTVMITDICDSRLEIASKCGIDHTVNPLKGNALKYIKKVFGEDGPDTIYECVGAESTVDQALHYSRKGSMIIIVGVFGKKINVDMGLVQDKELNLKGSLMYTKEDYDKAIELIDRGKIFVDALITTHFSFNQFPDAYKYIESNQDDCLKVIINMQEI